MLIVKKFGGTSVGDQERIMNVAGAVPKNIPRAMMWWSFFPPWARPRISF